MDTNLSKEGLSLPPTRNIVLVVVLTSLILVLLCIAPGLRYGNLFQFDSSWQQTDQEPETLIVRPTYDFHPVPDQEVRDKNMTKWIVVNFRSFASNDTTRQLCNMQNWQTVVVGDETMPLNWTCGSSILLSVEKQRTLPYIIARFIPDVSLSQKNVGYLYAIHHGAEIILDTDGDQVPVGNHVHEPTLKEFGDMLTWFQPGSLLVNPYAYFGRADVWPRGYVEPHRSPNINSTQLSFHKASGLSIVQALTDRPDMDPFLTRTLPEDKKHVRFCNALPPLQLDINIFAPFNSKNTIFYGKSFWALLLPIFARFNLSDIWRGYWAQRLLWDIGERLTFQGPTTKQFQDADNSASELDEEAATTTARLVNALKNWTGTAATLNKRFMQLMRMLLHQGFIDMTDYTLAQAWIWDLELVGYRFPDIQAINNKSSFDDVVKIPDAVLHCLQRCTFRQQAEPHIRKYFEDILLVVHFNWPHYNVIPSYLDLYAAAFPNIVYYGPPGQVDVAHDVIFYLNSDGGWHSHFAFLDAYRRFGKQYRGILFTNDDVMLHYWNMIELTNHKELVWYTFNETVKFALDISSLPENAIDLAKGNPNVWHWPRFYNPVREAYKEMPDWAIRYSANFVANFEIAAIGGSSDIIYMPVINNTKFFIEVLGIMAKGERDVAMEIAYPSSLMLSGSFNRSDIYGAKFRYAWHMDLYDTLKNHPEYHLQAAHPIKLSSFENQQLVFDVLFRDRPMDALGNTPDVLDIFG